MTKASLYINSKGYPVTRHSYSGSGTFNYCARKYYLERIAGWKERKQSAAMQFGITMEAAVTAFHSLDLESALALFRGRWEIHKDNPELEYSAKDGSWEELNMSGQEMLRLYAIKYPNFDFTIPDQSSFQVNQNYEVFPGTDLAGLELTSYIDIIAKLRADRGEPDLQDTRVILDMKVSGESCPTLVSLDPQLRTYSWVTGIPTVGFLWFKKVARTLDLGTEVTFLGTEDPHGVFTPGQTLYVLSPLTQEVTVVVADKKLIMEFKALKGKTKEVIEARAEFLTTHGVSVPESCLTRQEVSVRTATISDESRLDIQKQVEQDIVRIVHANETDFWPMQGGVRFPNNKCTFCAMRGICSGNDRVRDELVARDGGDSF